MNKPVLVRADSLRRHQALIDAATELFLEVGYSAASMNQLVERAGGSKSSIYAYFRDKEGLFVAVIDDMVRDILLPLHTLIREEQDLEESLRLVADRTLAVLTSPKGLGLSRIVYSESVKLPAVGQAFYQHGPGRAIEELADYLQGLNVSGKISCCDPHSAAEFFWGMLLHKPMLQGMCGTERPMSTRNRKAYVAGVVETFIDRFIE
jgi:AcrR family transcriptional regulator